MISSRKRLNRMTFGLGSRFLPGGRRPMRSSGDSFEANGRKCYRSSKTCGRAGSRPGSSASGFMTSRFRDIRFRGCSGVRGRDCFTRLTRMTIWRALRTLITMAHSFRSSCSILWKGDTRMKTIISRSGRLNRGSGSTLADSADPAPKVSFGTRKTWRFSIGCLVRSKSIARIARISRLRILGAVSSFTFSQAMARPNVWPIVNAT